MAKKYQQNRKIQVHKPRRRALQLGFDFLRPRHADNLTLSEIAALTGAGSSLPASTPSKSNETGSGATSPKRGKHAYESRTVKDA